MTRNCECKTCVENFDFSEEFQNVKTGEKYNTRNINNPRNLSPCLLNNVIYLIECVLCGQQYVGLTKTKFRDRVNQYRFKCNSGTGNRKIHKHFNGVCPSGANFNQHAKFKIIDRLSDESSSSREDLQNMESYWIEALNTAHPNGLNVQPGTRNGAEREKRRRRQNRRKEEEEKEEKEKVSSLFGFQDVKLDNNDEKEKEKKDRIIRRKKRATEREGGRGGGGRERRGGKEKEEEEQQQQQQQEKERLQLQLRRGEEEEKEEEEERRRRRERRKNEKEKGSTTAFKYQTVRFEEERLTTPFGYEEEEEEEKGKQFTTSFRYQTVEFEEKWSNSVRTEKKRRERKKLIITTITNEEEEEEEEEESTFTNMMYSFQNIKLEKNNERKTNQEEEGGGGGGEGIAAAIFANVTGRRPKDEKKIRNKRETITNSIKEKEQENKSYLGIFLENLGIF